MTSLDRSSLYNTPLLTEVKKWGEGYKESHRTKRQIDFKGHLQEYIWHDLGSRDGGSSSNKDYLAAANKTLFVVQSL